MAKDMFSLKLEGAKRLDRTLGRLGWAARSAVRGALRKAAQPVKAEFRASAPRSDQGDFVGPVKHAADTMTISGERSRGGAAAVELGGGFRLQGGALSLGDVGKSGDVAIAVGPSKEGFYLFFSEVGTSRQPARPWARPAWDRTKHKALAIFSREIWRSVERAVKRAARKGAR